MTAAELPLARPPYTASNAGRWALIAVGGCFAAGLMFGAVSGGLVALLVGAAAALLIAYAAWRWPLPTVIALMALLPLSRFLSFAAFAATDSTTVLRASQIWKDAVLIVLAVRMLHEAFLRGESPRIKYLDILVLVYLAMSALYFFYPGVQDSSPLVRLLAFRQDAFYLLAYFIGRGLNFEKRHLRQMMLVLAGVSVLTAAVAVWQFAAPTMSNDLFEKLGYSRFTEAVGTPHEVELVRSRELSTGELPRASSLFLADLGLAFFQLLMIPLAAGIFFCVRRGLGNLGSGLYLLLMIGAMGITVARAPIVAAMLGLGVVVMASRSFVRATWVGTATVALVLAFILLSGFSPGTLGEMFSSEESSAFAHTELIRTSTELLQDNPLGLGLGNGSHVSILADNLGSDSVPAWAAETWYLQLGLEMGVAAIFLFAAILVTATVGSLLAAFRVGDAWLQAITLGVAGAGIGFILVGFFHPVWASVQVAALFWFFAGISARARELDDQWSADAEPAS